MKKITSLVIILLITLTTFAVPAYRGWQTKSQPDGTTIQLRLIGDEFHHYWADDEGNIIQQDANGYWRVVEATPSAETIAARRKASPMLQSRPKRAIGDRNFAPRGLVILVNFKDSKFASENSLSDMHDLMNSDSYTYNGATGSVRQYFSDQSDGQYTPDFDVVGPVTLKNNVAHYGGNNYNDEDKLPGNMIVEACSIANANYKVDFTQYDNDNDGYVDFVYVIYAGLGEADGGAANTIWPHNWDLKSAYYYENCTYDRSERMFDGKEINNYACSGEIDGQTGKRAGIGTIAHEFSHVIGLPDLYDISYGQNHENEATPGAWHLMDAGSYNNNGNTPPNYTIYDKYFLGWKTPVTPGNEPQLLTLQPAGTKEYNAYQITTGNTLLPYTSTTTAYYIENRQQSGWDAHLPGHGLVIWKVQYNDQAWANNGPNDVDGKLRYTIVSATGKTTQLGTDADPFPGTKRKTEWRGISSKPLLNITETNGVISLNYIEIPDETSWKYEVLYENATVSSEQGKVLKDGTLTLTVKPAYGYLLDETMIEVEENNATRDFTYAGTTLTINNVKGNLGIYIMPEVDPNAPETPDTPVSSVVTLVPSDFDAIEGQQFEVEKDGITLSCSNGTITADQFRFFKSQTLTISSTAGNITSIEFTCTAANNTKYGPGSFGDLDGYTYSGKVGTWTGNTASITFSTTNNQVRATQIVVTIAGEGGGNTPDEPEDPDTPDTPDTPTIDTNITGLKEADAVYVADATYGDYWVFDLFAGYDYEAEDYIYPEVYVMVNEAYGKNTINGTYNIYYTEYFPTASSEGIYTDEYAEDFVGTLTIKNTDNSGNYSFKGSFVAEDGQTYTFDQVVKVTAYEYLEDSDGAYYEELTLSENGTPADPEEPDTPDTPEEPETPDTPTEGIVFIPADFSATTSTAFDLQKSNVSIHCSSGTVNADQFRFFKNQTVTISATGAVITSIEFTCAEGNSNYGPGGFTTATGYTYSGNVGTWQGNASSVQFTASKNQVRATKIVVKIAKDSTSTGLEDLLDQPTPEVHKLLHNGQILIHRNGKTYTIMGQEL